MALTLEEKEFYWYLDPKCPLAACIHLAVNIPRRKSSSPMYIYPSKLRNKYPIPYAIPPPVLKKKISSIRKIPSHSKKK